MGPPVKPEDDEERAEDDEEGQWMTR